MDKWSGDRVGECERMLLQWIEAWLDGWTGGSIDGNG